MRRSLLLHGLKITLSRPRAVLWTYAFNVGLALLFSVRIHAQLDSILAHSLASQRLTSAFDLGVLASAVERFNERAPATGSSNLLGPAFFLLIYFLLVPGTLFCYVTEAPARLSVLLSIGFQRFWRFFRIALLTLIVSGLVLGPLFALQSAWSTHVDETSTGYPALLRTWAGYVILAIVASILRLYFDLVEVYTIQLGEQLRPDGRPDRRVRRVLLPALRTLRRNFLRALLSFLSLAVLGFLALLFTWKIALHTLAQPRVWPAFLLVQLGLFALLFTRFWQRGAETALAADHPLPASVPRPEPPRFLMNPADSPIASTQDPQPNPEPAPPSLSEPDPAIFHHDPPSP